jgi:Xaa-Pro aminopeptidase
MERPARPLSPGLKEKYGVDEVRRGNGGERLLSAAPAHDCLAVIAPVRDLKDDRSDVQALKQAAAAQGHRLVYKRDLLARLRSAHGSEEIALMERAVAITRAGHEAVARATVAGVSERDVQTQMEYAFFGAGATGLSYGSIVGSGENGASTCTTPASMTRRFRRARARLVLNLSRGAAGTTPGSGPRQASPPARPRPAAGPRS